jgi:hypothetical protein
MNFSLAVFALIATSSAMKLCTLPDVRSDLVADSDIQAHENARHDAALVKQNPQWQLLETIRGDLEQVNKDLSFGISYSQHSRNDDAKTLCTKVGTAIKGYATGLIATVEGAPDEVLTEQNAHNISSIVFYDVQL